MRQPTGSMFALLLGAWLAPQPAAGQVGRDLAAADRIRLAEALRLAAGVRATVWPGWERTAMPVLLVGNSSEFLLGHPVPSSDFTPLGFDSILRREILVRPRRFPPQLLATFPAVGGKATIVVGSAERTGKASTEWTVTLLHEHFHQWQSSLPEYYHRVGALGLARGDTTGRWMLDYPFPYDTLPVVDAVGALAGEIVAALRSPGAALDGVIRRREYLRRLLAPDDDRYLEFQLWQEGVPRFVEIAVAEAAARAGAPSADFRALPDYTPYSSVAANLRRELERGLVEMDLRREQRLAFYTLGAGLALLLERTDRGWKGRYERRPFVLSP